MEIFNLIFAWQSEVKKAKDDYRKCIKDSQEKIIKN